MHHGLFALLILPLIVFCSAFPTAGVAVVFMFSLWEAPAAFGSFRGSPGDLAAAAFVLGSVMRLGIMRGRDRITLPVFHPYFLFAVCVLPPVLLSLHPLHSVPVALRWLLYAATAAFVQEWLMRRRTLSFLYPIFTFLLFLSGMTALFQWMDPAEGVPLRIHGGFLDWNYFPIFVALILPFVLEQIGQQKDRIENAILVLLVVLSTGMALAAKSRSGTAMILAVYAGWFGMKAVPAQKRLQAAAVGLPVFLLAAYLITTDSHTLSVYWQNWLASPRLQERILNHFYMARAFVGHPLLGVGPGQYEAYVAWLGLPSPYPISGSHSSVFSLLAETGLVGTLPWLGLLCGGTATALSSGFLDPSTPYRRGPILAMGILLLSTLVYSVHTPLFTWCMMGALFAMAGKPSTSTSVISEAQDTALLAS